MPADEIRLCVVLSSQSANALMLLHSVAKVGDANAGRGWGQEQYLSEKLESILMEDFERVFHEPISQYLKHFQQHFRLLDHPSKQQRQKISRCAVSKWADQPR